ncbi:MAG TPA: VCBS repeat-containing protein [Bacteroidales bacterium]|nr:VCBS repeat-containing protein [Bacteroidales bacterium]
MKALFILFSFICAMAFNETFAQQFNPEKTRIKTKGLISPPINTYLLCVVDIDYDGDMDFLGASDFGQVFLLNSGTSQLPSFESPKKRPFGLKGMMNATYADIDNDGDLDAFGMKFSAVGTFKSLSLWSENTGTKSTPVFDKAVPFGFGMSENFFYKNFVDIDGDGDLDLIGVYRTGQNIKESRVAMQENVGTAKTPEFSQVEFAPLGLIENSTAYIYFSDIDGDGDFDAYYTAYTEETGKNVFIQWNEGNSTNAEFSDPHVGFTGMLISYGDNIFSDINGDGIVENIIANDIGLFYQIMIVSKEEE